MRNLFVTVAGVIFMVFGCNVNAFEGLYYLNTHSKSAVSVERQMQDFSDHGNKVDISALRFYIIDAKGRLASSRKMLRRLKLSSI